MEQDKYFGELNCKKIKGIGDGVLYQPNHTRAKNLAFANELEANLCDAISRVSTDNGMTLNEVYAAIPFILRMLKSKSEWTK